MNCVMVCSGAMGAGMGQEEVCVAKDNDRDCEELSSGFHFSPVLRKSSISLVVI